MYRYLLQSEKANIFKCLADTVEILDDASFLLLAAADRNRTDAILVDINKFLYHDVTAACQNLQSMKKVYFISFWFVMLLQN